jgi:hypothetical protein
MTIKTYEVALGTQNLDTCVKGSATCEERDNYNAYNELKAKSKTIGTRLLDLKKTWYKSANKEQQYINEIKYESKIKAKEKTDQWKFEFDNIYNSIKTTYFNLETMEKYCPTAEFMVSKYRKDNIKKHVDTKNTIKEANIENRLTAFYNNSDYYEDLLYYIKWIYWVMVLFCIVMLFMSGQFRNVKAYWFFIVLLAFPTLALQPIITWANTNISQVKINTLYFIFLIMGGLVISLLYYSGNYAMPMEKIQQPQSQ